MRSVTGLCVAFGGLAGGFAPSLWGGSSFSLASVVTTAAGAIAGLWLGVKLSA